MLLGSRLSVLPCPPTLVNEMLRLAADAGDNTRYHDGLSVDDFVLKSFEADAAGTPPYLPPYSPPPTTRSSARTPVGQQQRQGEGGSLAATPGAGVAPAAASDASAWREVLSPLAKGCAAFSSDPSEGE